MKFTIKDRSSFIPLSFLQDHFNLLFIKNHYMLAEISLGSKMVCRNLGWLVSFKRVKTCKCK